MDASGLEIWGGIECTVARIGDRYIDQTHRTGHHYRSDDLKRIASLGITHLRYPLLWERIAPHGLDHADWSWTDERLHMLRELGITPIATLLHHGSGPRYTNLLDPEFPQKLAQFARAVARRYPWLEYFTPVNEPLTTARFMALYGWWYPHRSDDVSFCRALFNEIEGIVQAMNAIREESPRAKLVTTEDLGKTYSTDTLRYQAEHENERRFLSYDLLCGRLEQNTIMRAWLEALGFDVRPQAQERFIAEPDILGFNYYVTSERWLDDRIERYPGAPVGGNALDRYVDIEAVRVCTNGIAGVGPLLEEAWARYDRPVAVTEAHLACTREQQLRWLRDIHADVTKLRAGGVPVRAMTVWSLFGAFDWNSALTRQDGFYEPGAFDVSGGEPRETAIAEYVRFLAGLSPACHPAVEGSGWWRTDSRITYAPAHHNGTVHAGRQDAMPVNRRPILIVGGREGVRDDVIAHCRERDLHHIVQCDVGTDSDAEPWDVFDCSALSPFDDIADVLDRLIDAYPARHDELGGEAGRLTA